MRRGSMYWVELISGTGIGVLVASGVRAVSGHKYHYVDTPTKHLKYDPQEKENYNFFMVVLVIIL